MQPHTSRFCEHTITYRVPCNTTGQPIDRRQNVDTAETAALLASLLHGEPSDVFGILCLTATHHIIGYYEIGRGLPEPMRVIPREVCRTALIANASAIVLAHNQQSGVPTPTCEDLELTRRLVNASETLCIDVLDVIVIIGGDTHMSVRRMCTSDPRVA